MRNHKPIPRFRAGRVICALFENEVEGEGQPRRILRAALALRYMDRWGYWKSSFSFSKEEIPLAIHVLKRAFERMVDRHIDDEIARAIELAASEPLPRDAKRPAA
jgi:hypothetical protein